MPAATALVRAPPGSAGTGQDVGRGQHSRVRGVVLFEVASNEHSTVQSVVIVLPTRKSYRSIVVAWLCIGNVRARVFDISNY